MPALRAQASGRNVGRTIDIRRLMMVAQIMAYSAASALLRKRRKPFMSVCSVRSSEVLWTPFVSRTRTKYSVKTDCIMTEMAAWLMSSE